jgi:hypothetical protein
MNLSKRAFFSLIVIFSTFQTRAQLTTTNLPIVIITSVNPVDSVQAQASLSIVDNISGTNNITDPPTFTGMIGINTRGNSSYNKKSYTVETWSAPTVSQNVPILGMPAENDWVLLAAYPDRSLLRNSITMNLHEKMGRYAPRMKHCEVLVNGQYMGIYLFGEKIKRDSLRLDLAKLTNLDNFGENMTGGYILKVNEGAGNGWVSMIAPPYATTQQIKFNIDYPDPSDITPSQKAYIQSYIDSFENAMNAANFQDTTLGWRRFGAVNGFADFMIMNEVSRNNEAYRKNMYMFKDKSKKLRPGPLWAFDIAWNNTQSCAGSKDTGWTFNLGGTCPLESDLAPFWFSKLLTDTSFVKDLRCLYTDYRKPGNVLDTAKIFFNIDSINTRLNAQGAVARNFTQWPIWGVPIVNEPTPMAANYAEEVANLKQFIRKRIIWLDSKWILNTGCPAPLAVSDIDLTNQFAIYPNPVNDIVNISFSGKSKNGYNVSVYSIQGSKIYSSYSKERSTSINISTLPKGMYLLNITSDKGSMTRKIVKE